MTTKIPVELSSTPGIVDGSNATAITIDSSENVGIGQTSPSSPNSATDFLHIGSSSSTYSSLILEDNNNTWEIFQNNQLSIRDGTATRLLIDTSGNVGIGTTSPSRVLHTEGASVLFGTTSGAHEILFGDSAHRYFKLYTPSSPDYASIRTGTTNILVAHSDGTVGIGLTTPSDNNTKCLYLKGNENVMSIRNLSTSNAGERVSIDFLDHNGTRRGYVSVDTSGTLFSTTSDYRLKNVIEPVTNGIERINKLNPVKFEWKETGKEEEGFIAHEVDEIFKDAVGGKKDAVNEDGSIDAQTMDYGRITPLLVKAIQEQQEQIEQLKTEIQTLKGE